ncbi:MAG: tyrosine-type recombinase/integrase, partial [Bacilli bacterium]|nr:tyrosine-type recombinase/integrase [Bacilli bacterium]
DKPIHYNTLNTRFDKIYTQLKLNHKPHDGRHTFETALSELSIEVVVRNAIMGHEQEGIGDKVYNHISLERKLLAVNLLNTYV